MRIVPIIETPFLMSPALSRSFVVRVLMSALARVPRYHDLRLSFFRRFVLSWRVKQILRQLPQTEGDIWLTASTPELILIGQSLTTGRHRVRLMVWDSPEYLAENLRLTRGGREQLLTSFASLLSNAERISVVSEAMQLSYGKLTKSKPQPIIIRHGVQAPLASCSTSFPASASAADEIRLAFAGSLYAKREWNALIAALDSVNWKISGKRVGLLFIGQFPLSGAIRSPRVQYLGRMSFEDTLATLQTASIGYLPYWFDRTYEHVARTSFPGKISSYAAAGLAVFHHAPQYTDVVTFLQRHPFGLNCSSLDAEEITSTLARLAEYATTAECHSARAKAVSRELSKQAMQTRLMHFLRDETS